MLMPRIPPPTMQFTEIQPIEPTEGSIQLIEPTEGSIQLIEPTEGSIQLTEPPLGPEQAHRTPPCATDAPIELPECTYHPNPRSSPKTTKTVQFFLTCLK